MIDIAEIKTKIIKVLDGYQQIELVIIYGSAVTNRLTPNSDIDIAIGSSNTISNSISMDISLKLTHLLDIETSVTDIDKMEGVIMEEVLTKGEILRNLNPEFLFKNIQKMQTYTEDILPFQVIGTKKLIEDYLSGK